MNRPEGCAGASSTTAALTDAVVVVLGDKFRRQSSSDSTVVKRANRKSLEFPPHRRVYDAGSLSAVVKKSFSFDRKSDGEIVTEIVTNDNNNSVAERRRSTGRKVQLSYAKDGKSVIIDSVASDNGDNSNIDGEGESSAPPCLRSELRRPRGGRCRSSPSAAGLWPGERPRPTRLCRTWYAGYGPLIEDEPLFIQQQKSRPSATVASCGARRRAEGRRRRVPPVDPPVRLTASTASLNLLPRISATVIPLRRKDAEGAQLTRSARPLLEREQSTLSLLHPAALEKSRFARSAHPLLDASDPVGVHGLSNGAPPLRKCETVLALSTGEEPLRPVNRLRSASNGRVCSRCSSLLSLAATGSRYSLAATGGFVPLLCKLCLEDVPASDLTDISDCGCLFCSKCMKSYVEYEIMNGAYDISCPDSRCPTQGVMQTTEVEKLVSQDLVEKHRKFRLNHEVAMDGARAFCPRAGCETVCIVSSGANGNAGSTGSSSGAGPPQPVLCPTCSHHFCSSCTNKWHPGMDCTAHMRQMALEAGADNATVSDGLIGLTGESDLIKWCPMCRVPIEKDEGCAQMMCKRCKHVFCWYCLASLDDDFLLRHYDKGPCKNKLGHSRASVIWHRAQVVGIFAGFGLLLLVASPLLLLAAPCIIGCKCRLCNTHGKTVDPEEMEGMDLELDDAANEENRRVATPITD